MKTLKIRSREDWRKWLADNYAKEVEIWLVFQKKHTGVSNVPYEVTVEEALCFGWIDSIIKRLNENQYVRKYTPRKPGSPWSQLNQARAKKMIRAGCMTGAGLILINEAKSSGEWGQMRTRPRIQEDAIPQELLNALSGNPNAERHFHALAPSYLKHYVMWVALAKRAETRLRRVLEAIQKLERGERLGLK
jgi:uncharacterized protein YdeI (YjbR/CyaY-like superfamily)